MITLGLLLMRCIIHIDMDAFFASVEQLDDPNLKDKPVLVGGSLPRGVVSAASYAARSWGVHSAMPMAEAINKCPYAIVLRPRFHRYSEVSARLFDVFRRYTPLVEGLSLDEAFLDVTESTRLFGSGSTIAQAIKKSVKKEVGLTASAGVASCKFVAKIASDLEKPDGLVIVPKDEVRFLAPLSISRMWGIGPVTQNRLQTMGIKTIGDLRTFSEIDLVDLMGVWGKQVYRLARGIDERPVDPERPTRSIGSEETFDRDIRSKAALYPKLLKHSTRIARRLSNANMWAHVVRIKVKFADFKLLSRQLQLKEAVMDTDTIYRIARRLFDRIENRSTGIRLIGVSVLELTEQPSSLGLFPDLESEKKQRLERVTADLSKRFGSERITRAALLDK